MYRNGGRENEVTVCIEREEERMRLPVVSQRRKASGMRLQFVSKQRKK